MKASNFQQMLQILVFYYNNLPEWFYYSRLTYSSILYFLILKHAFHPLSQTH